MIYTLTVNPSLDYVIKLKNFEAGGIYRTNEEELIYGGKGVNVSVMLHNLGIESLALGFVAGDTGILYESGLRATGIRTSFLSVSEGMTRINVKISSDDETEINGQGSRPTEEDLEKMKARLALLKQGDILVVSGSVQKCIPDTFYAQIVREANRNGVLCVVDTSGAPLLHVLEEKPFLIKPNIQELEEIFQCPIREGLLLSSMQAIQQKGVRNVLVSCGEKGAYLLDERGAFLYGTSLQGKVVSTVGCGDAMVAGFMYGWLKAGDYEEAFRMAIAAGGATAFTNGIAGGKAVQKVIDDVKIEVMRPANGSQ